MAAHLTVVPRDVVRCLGESGARRFVEQGGVGAVEIVVMEVERKERGAVITGVVRAGISPFASDGLDEAFGLAVGLRAIGFSEEMFEAQLLAGGGEAF